MKFSLFFIILALNASLLHATIRYDKGIYGDDNRRYIDEGTVLERKLGRSVLAQVPLYKIISQDQTSVMFDVSTPDTALNICQEEKFSSDSMLSSCSGFLVAPDLLMTAGHCLKDKTDCQKNLWLLDYDQSQKEFKKDQIVYCKEIVDSNALTDYALVRLSRAVVDRAPLKIRQSGKLNPKTDFVVIGHPLGLPKIVTDQAFLRGNLLNKTFTISSDTYSGNSGSPVIDSETSLVEGILVKGDQDFEMDYLSGCKRSVHCDDNTCTGETVLRSASIPLSFLQ
jgi:S1-C subfamily serine protease